MEGVVIKSTGSWLTVREDNGNIVNCKLKGKFRIKGIKTTNPVAVGDNVVFDMVEDSGTGAIKQSQIDSFQINYPNCTVIEGSVIISGNDISNLNELSVLTTIQGDLKIEYNDSLIQLTGLNNLTSIGGDLRIGVNDALTSLSGLAKLTHIGRHLFIGYWDAWVEYVGNPSVLSYLSINFTFTRWDL